MKSNKPHSSTPCLNLYFQVHQPRRLRKFQFFDIGSGAPYFDDGLNQDILEKIAKNCYLPANEMLFRLIKRFPELRITFSISGSAIEQMEQYTPELIASFQRLAQTGAVEFLGETYYHSLSYFVSEEEFSCQVLQHRKKITELFGYTPVIFRNTELIYSDAIGRAVSLLGFKGIYLDGVDRILPEGKTHHLYKHPDTAVILFPRSYGLSDDIAFRYSDRGWSEWPLTAAKFTQWLNKNSVSNDFISLGMDYETFGEHQKAEGGIFSFFEKMVAQVALQQRLRFVNPSEAISLLTADRTISTHHAISWADQERDLSAWLGNDMQKEAFRFLKKLLLESENHDPELRQALKYLQTSDHFYYMSTKKDSDGEVHQYFSPYSSPYEAFMNYMNILSDIEYQFRKENTARRLVQRLDKVLSEI